MEHSSACLRQLTQIVFEIAGPAMRVLVLKTVIQDRTFCAWEARRGRDEREWLVDRGM